jgi:hypothetical protein
MKCMRRGEEVIRVTDDAATVLEKDGWKYVTKGVWKAEGRPGDVTEDNRSRTIIKNAQEKEEARAERRKRRKRKEQAEKSATL